MSSMVRLNAAIRDETVKNLLNKKYVKENLERDRLNEVVEKLEEELKPMAYEVVYSKAQRERLADAPEGWFPKATHVSVRVEKQGQPENYTDEIVRFGEEMRIPYGHYYGSFAAVLTDDLPYFQKRKEMKAAKAEADKFANELAEKKRADRRRVETIIASVTTVKRLTEIWPEVKEYLPEMVSGEGGGVPAEIIADINRDFGLGK